MVPRNSHALINLLNAKRFMQEFRYDPPSGDLFNEYDNSIEARPRFSAAQLLCRPRAFPLSRDLEVSRSGPSFLKARVTLFSKVFYDLFRGHDSKKDEETKLFSLVTST